MRIRDYKAEDDAALLSLFKRAVLEGAAGEYSLEQRNAWAQAINDAQCLHDRLSGQIVAVCEMNGEIAGFSGMETDGHLDMLFVHPHHLRRGVASALYRYLENWAKAKGLVRIFTEASLTANPFFEKQGFEVIERQTVARNGIGLDNFRMQKKLEPKS